MYTWVPTLRWYINTVWNSMIGILSNEYIIMLLAFGVCSFVIDIINNIRRTRI